MGFRKKIFFSMLIVVMALLQKQSFGFSMGYHCDLIREVLQHEEFNERTIRLVLAANEYTDIFGTGESYMLLDINQYINFDADLEAQIKPLADYLHTTQCITLEQLRKYNEVLIQNMDRFINQDLEEMNNHPEYSYVYYARMLIALGISLHCVEDLYAHTNWAELKMPNYFKQLKDATFFDLYHAPQEELKPAIDAFLKRGFPKSSHGIYSIFSNEAATAPMHDDIKKDYAAQADFDDAYCAAFKATLQWVRWIESKMGNYLNDFKTFQWNPSDNTLNAFTDYGPETGTARYMCLYGGAWKHWERWSWEEVTMHAPHIVDGIDIWNTTLADEPFLYDVWRPVCVGLVKGLFHIKLNIDSCTTIDGNDWIDDNGDIKETSILYSELPQTNTSVVDAAIETMTGDAFQNDYAQVSWLKLALPTIWDCNNGDGFLDGNDEEPGGASDYYAEWYVGTDPSHTIRYSESIYRDRDLAYTNCQVLKPCWGSTPMNVKLQIFESDKDDSWGNLCRNVTFIGANAVVVGSGINLVFDFPFVDWAIYGLGEWLGDILNLGDDFDDEIMDVSPDNSTEELNFTVDPANLNISNIPAELTAPNKMKTTFYGKYIYTRGNNDANSAGAEIQISKRKPTVKVYLDVVKQFHCLRLPDMASSSGFYGIATKFTWTAEGTINHNTFPERSNSTTTSIRYMAGERSDEWVEARGTPYMQIRYEGYPLDMNIPIECTFGTNASIHDTRLIQDPRVDEETYDIPSKFSTELLYYNLDNHRIMNSANQILGKSGDEIIFYNEHNGLKDSVWVRITVDEGFVPDDPCEGVKGGGNGFQGTPFGLNPPYVGGSQYWIGLVQGYCRATDGDINTYYDYSIENGGRTGLDLGTAKVIGKIRYYPRNNYASRMVGGKFQGSNDGILFTDLYTISSTPQMQWNEMIISNTTAYRYVRYLAPDNSYGNIAEMEFYPPQYTITATSGTHGSISPRGAIWVNSGESKSFTITPEEGYLVNNVRVDNQYVGATTYYEFSDIDKSHSIIATFIAATQAQTPYNGPHNITNGATLQAEDFDNGGEDVAYHDNDVTNSGGAYRATEWVDIENGTASVVNVGWTAAGEWMEYTCNVTGGTYNITLYAASPNSGDQQVKLYQDNTLKATFTVPNTGGWQTYQTIYVNGVTLDANSQSVLRLESTTGGYNVDKITFSSAATQYSITAVAGANGSIDPNGTMWVNSGESKSFTITPNRDYLVYDVMVDNQSIGATTYYEFSDINRNHSIMPTFIAATSTQTPYNGPHNISNLATLQAEDFDNGGEGTAYHDNDVTNSGSAYRTTEGVDIENGTTSVVNVGWTAAGEWMEYTCNVTGGIYNITLYAASPNSGDQQVKLYQDNTLKATFTITNTGNWQAYQTFSINGVSLDVNPQSVLRLESTTGGYNIDKITFSSAVIQYTLMAIPDANGMISPNGPVTVNSGASKTFTITPNSGYQVSTVTIDGTNQGAMNSYTFSNVTENHIIRATFKLATQTQTPYNGPHNITNGATLQAEDFDNGGEGTAYHDNDVTNSGGAYRTTEGVDIENGIDSVVNVGWTTAGEWMEYTCNVTGETYNITLFAASPNSGSQQVKLYQDNTLKATFTVPNTGGWQTYQAISLNGVSLDTNSQSVLRLESTTGGYNIDKITFSKTVTQYTIMPIADVNGSISPSGPVTVNSGTSKTFTIIPNIGYQVGVVTVDGTSKGAVTSYTFPNVTSDHIITATFVGNNGVYEAENATLSGGAKKDTNHTGYSGTGFVDGFYNSTTARITFSVSAVSAGNYTAKLRYSAGNGTSSNTGLYVNGVYVKDISCPATSNWNTWADKSETVTLFAGNNTIEYAVQNSSSSCINFDKLTLSTVACTPPSIISSPASATTCPGNSAIMMVNASGATSWQWYKGSTPLSNSSYYAGAQTAKLTISSTNDTLAGSYSCVCSNGSCSATSSAAQLTVYPMPAMNTIWNSSWYNHQGVGGNPNGNFWVQVDAPAGTTAYLTITNSAYPQFNRTTQVTGQTWPEVSTGNTSVAAGTISVEYWSVNANGCESMHSTWTNPSW